MTPISPGRPEDSELAPHARAYVELVPGENIIEILQQQIEELIRLVQPLGDTRATTLAYAPGKWTVKEMLGHMSDTERIFSYRALRIARSDQTPLPGFEQDDYAPYAESNRRSLDSLLAELRVVRQSTLALLQSLSPEAWMRTGQVNNGTVSVRGIAFTTAGHERHHIKILQERYLPQIAD